MWRAPAIYSRGLHRGHSTSKDQRLSPLAPNRLLVVERGGFAPSLRFDAYGCQGLDAGADSQDASVPLRPSVSIAVAADGAVVAMGIFGGAGVAAMQQQIVMGIPQIFFRGTLH